MKGNGRDLAGSIPRKRGDGLADMAFILEKLYSSTGRVCRENVKAANGLQHSNLVQVQELLENSSVKSVWIPPEVRRTATYLPV